MARPYWLPPELNFEELPEGIRAAYKDVLEKIYDDQVLGAHDGLELSTGTTLAFICWLEIIQQKDIAECIKHRSCSVSDKEDFVEGVDRMFRLIGAKTKVTNARVRLDELRLKHLGNVDIGYTGFHAPQTQEETQDEVSDGEAG